MSPNSPSNRVLLPVLLPLSYVPVWHSRGHKLSSEFLFSKVALVLHMDGSVLDSEVLSSFLKRTLTTLPGRRRLPTLSGGNINKTDSRLLYEPFAFGPVLLQ